MCLYVGLIFQCELDTLLQQRIALWELLTAGKNS